MMTICGLKLNTKKIYWINLVLISVFYLIVATHSPLSVLAWQGYDDMLFINHAQSLAEGRWLGKFSELTLVKGPGYPAFLALNYWLGLPITFTHALFYCFSLAALSFLVLKISKSYLLAGLLFLVTLWDPRVFELNRVMRDAIYAAQAILILTTLSYILFFKLQRKHEYMLSILLGLLFAWFWLTREEGIWLLPGMVFLLIFATIKNRYQKNGIRIIRPLIIASCFFIAVHIMFGLGNWIAYGDFVTVDIKEKNFQAALKSMESIRIGAEISYLAVPLKVREEIYKISPEFSELKKYIDPENAVSTWQAGGCTFRPTTCGDIGNGFFMWALRDATGKAGHYSSPLTASKFYKSIDNDIKLACANKRLKCDKSYIPYMPQINFSQVKQIPSALISVWKSMSSAGNFYESTVWKIWGPESTFNRAVSVLNQPAHFPMIGISSNVEVAGWYHYQGKGNDWFNLKVSDDFNQDISYILTRVESLDLVNTFKDKDASHQRFLIKSRCSQGCKLTFLPKVGDAFILSIENSQQYISKNNHILAFDYINLDKGSKDNIRYNFSLKIRKAMFQLYQQFIPSLIISGLLTFAVSTILVFQKSQYSIIYAITTACWISIATRSAILVLVDISSFPAITVVYMQPIFALSLIASILSIKLIIDLFPSCANFNKKLFKLFHMGA